MSDDYEDVVDSGAGGASAAAGSDVSGSDITIAASGQVVDAADQAERDRAREELAADVEAFLAQGGEIQRVGVNVMADPPKRPQSNYGGQPI